MAIYKYLPNPSMHWPADIQNDAVCVKCYRLRGHNCIFRHSQGGRLAGKWFFPFSQIILGAGTSEDFLPRLEEVLAMKRLWSRK